MLQGCRKVMGGKDHRKKAFFLTIFSISRAYMWATPAPRRSPPPWRTGALPRLQTLSLCGAAIGDAGLVALAPALRLLPALLPIAGCCQRLRPQRRPLRSRTGARRRARDSAARCAGAQAALKVSVVCSAAQPAPRRLPPCKRHWQNRQPAFPSLSLLIVPPLCVPGAFLEVFSVPCAHSAVPVHSAVHYTL